MRLQRESVVVAFLVSIVFVSITSFQTVRISSLPTPILRNCAQSLLGSKNATNQQVTKAISIGGDSRCLSDEKRKLESYDRATQKAHLLRKQHGPLRVLAFSRLWVPPLHGTGGMQYHALHLYSQLAALGHLVHVLVTGPPDSHRVLSYSVDSSTLELREQPLAQASLVVHQVPSDRNGEYSVTWFENLLAKAQELNSTVGGFHVAHSESWAGVPNIHLLGLPMAVTWHGSMLDWFRNEMNMIVHNFRMKGKMPSDHVAQRMKDLGSSVAFETYMLLSVPHHIVISDSAADDLVELNLVDPNRVHLIYNGVNPANFHPSTTARATFLTSVGVSPTNFVVGCGGRLESIKGHHQLSEAMKLVMSSRSDVVLLVAGQGAEATRYEKLRSSGFKVVLLGMLSQNRLAQFYQSIDVFVDPFYQHHGLNTVMIEATLSGVPLVATRLASSKTTVPCSEFGRTFALGNVSDLADAILQLKNDATTRQNIGLRVRDRSLRLFTSTAMAGQYESVLYGAWLNPTENVPKLTGKVVCRHTYPAMCYREP